MRSRLIQTEWQYDTCVRARVPVNTLKYIFSFCKRLQWHWQWHTVIWIAASTRSAKYSDSMHWATTRNFFFISSSVYAVCVCLCVAMLYVFVCTRCRLGHREWSNNEWHEKKLDRINSVIETLTNRLMHQCRQYLFVMKSNNLISFNVLYGFLYFFFLLFLFFF